jgi:hypothetical protein
MIVNYFSVVAEYIALGKIVRDTPRRNIVRVSQVQAGKVKVV